MTLAGSVALFAVMVALAALPSSSVALVVARSAMTGVRSGLAAAVGIVAGDLVFMTIAILGMTALAAQLGAFFVVIRILAGAYLVWFGIQLIRSRNAAPAQEATGASPGRGNLPASFAAGLLLTLGDVKAIFFYASLLPAFVDLAALTATDIAIVTAITIVAVGSVKAVYAVAGERLAAWSAGFGQARRIKLAAGGFFVAAGGYLMLRH